MPGQLPIALVQIAPKKGDYAHNLARIRELLASLAALDAPPALVVFPETVMSGYFLEGGVREHAVTAGTLARDLDRAWREVAGDRAITVDVVIGFYELWRDTLHNSSLYVRLGATDGGEVVHVHRKHFLPTYGLFDEERFVERGLEIRAFETAWGKCAMLVCEDAWHSLSGTIAALDGAQLVCISAAAPARGAWPRDDAIPGPSTAARWERLARDIAEEHGVFVVLANLTGIEGGKAFGGHSVVVGPRGDVRTRGAVWNEEVVLLTLDLADVARARADTPLLADLRGALPHLTRMMEKLEAGAPRVVEYDGAEEPADGERRTANGRAAPDAPLAVRRSPSAAFPMRLVPDAEHSHPAPLEIDAPLLESWLVAFIRHEMSRRGFAKAVVGMSGGVDSAVTAFLAARALGPENVIGVRLPYRTSSAESLAHAQLVLDALGIEGRTLEITNAVDGYLALEPDADGARRGNVMARMRMIALFDLSAKHRALPLGTGNKTERLFGYFTWHADDSPPINPLGDLFKTQVWALARHLGVPDVIVSKPPTADLVVGQTDEGDFGISYARADELLNWMLHGWKPDELVRRGFDPAEIALVRKRLESTHWKRRLPTVAMVSGTAIGESYLRPVDY